MPIAAPSLLGGARQFQLHIPARSVTCTDLVGDWVWTWWPTPLPVVEPKPSSP